MTASYVRGYQDRERERLHDQAGALTELVRLRSRPA